MSQIDVIIPYYQKKTGILQRALQSILAQTLPAGVSVNVIVVDDGSPSPAEMDTVKLSFAAPFKLTLVKKVNEGVAAARDDGLKQTTDKTDYIAFLDSDDFWKPDHIAKAVNALEQGYDFYFADHDRVGHHTSHFDYIGFPPPEAQAVLLSGKLWAIDKDFYFNYSLRHFTAQISTVVYRRSVKPAAAFKKHMRASGEDALFMLEVVASARKICFSREVGATCGEGVNIYYSTYGWNDEGHLRRNMADILATYALRSHLKLTGDNERFMIQRGKEVRRQFAYFTLRWFLKRRGPWSPELRALVNADPDFPTWYPLALLQVMIMYPLGLFKPI